MWFLIIFIVMLWFLVIFIVVLWFLIISIVLQCCISSALELTPKDPKALFRRGQAYDAQNNFDKAYADMRAVQELDPRNKDVHTMLTRLHRLVQDKVREARRGVATLQYAGYFLIAI